ncbi:phospholipase D family protein [Flavobacterium sp. YO64]|uniref:phospholipase D family protein n=1 Tax=Flavobacterium sp. YO64 TaxID=394559 RepID=UPI00100BD8E7|nr:phospholipase D family protein [Flavobacterium sp. YO64]RXM44176.1 hypothetical protein BOW57_09810 [Flavobacterium sp. YO64]
MVPNLESRLKPILQQAKSFYIATALISEAGYRFIEKNAPENCRRHYIIGIDLGINPKILEKLLTKSIQGAIHVKLCKTQHTFHPKVYLIEKNDGTFAVIIGSANTTLGGLANNVEMSVLVDSQQQCAEILAWFRALYDASINLSDEILTEYTKYYKNARQRNAAGYADLAQFKNMLPSAEIHSHGLEKQYFKLDDFNAFSSMFHRDKSTLAKQNRKNVKLRFIALHNSIFSRFAQYGLDNLSPHKINWHTVSSHFHSARSRPVMDAMWLQYGSEENLSDHPRLQVILRGNTIGIWLMIGKNKGSRREREKLKSNLKDDLFAELLFQNIKNLGAVYWIDLNNSGDRRSISSIEDPAELKKLLLTDNVKNYFTIGRNYLYTDDQLSDENIEETVLLEFQRLNVVYKNMIYGMY